MIFNGNTTYQTLRILIAIFGALGMTAALTPMKKSPKKNLLIWSAYVIYAFLFTSASIYFLGFLFFTQCCFYYFSAWCYCKLLDFGLFPIQASL